MPFFLDCKSGTPCFYVQDEGEEGVEREGEGEAEVEGQGEAEVESEGELRHDHGERDQSSQEVDIGDQREESEGRATESEEEKEEYGQRVVTSRRRDIIESGSDRSEENRYGDNDEEVNQARSPRWFLLDSNIFNLLMSWKAAHANVS